MASFADAVRALKADLQKAIQDRLENFYKETGVWPSEVRVPMLDVTNQSSPVPQMVVGTVRLEFDL